MASSCNWMWTITAWNLLQKLIHWLQSSVSWWSAGFSFISSNWLTLQELKLNMRSGSIQLALRPTIKLISYGFHDSYQKNLHFPHDFNTINSLYLATYFWNSLSHRNAQKQFTISTLKPLLYSCKCWVWAILISFTRNITMPICSAWHWMQVDPDHVRENKLKLFIAQSEAVSETNERVN